MRLILFVMRIEVGRAALNPKKSLYFEKTMYNRLKSLTLR